MQPEEIIDLLVRARDICDDMVDKVSPKHCSGLEAAVSCINAVINLIDKDLKEREDAKEGKE